MRCSALAEGLKKSGYEVAFISRAHDEAITAKIRSAGYYLYALPATCSMEEDLERTITLLKDRDEPPTLIIDCYDVDASYQKAVKRAGLPLVVMDDLAEEHSCADLLLNPNIYARQDLYSTEAYTQLLLGPHYALLREQFLLRRDHRRSIPERARHILVTLGGSDPNNQTLKVVRAIRMLSEEIRTLVVVGPTYPHGDSLVDYVNRSGGRFVLRANVECMAELMCWADVAVSAGGSTCWELACLGVPNVVMALADNQRQNGPELARAGISIDLGWWEDVSEELIAETLRQLIEHPKTRGKMSKAGQALVDGKGVFRVAEAIQGL